MFSISIDCYSLQVTKSFNALKDYNEGFFRGVQVKVENGNEVVQLSPISLVEYKDLLNNIESVNGKIVEILWQGEMETMTDKNSHVRVLQINEDPTAMQNRSLLYKNTSVENIYNYLLNNKLTRDLVSIKPNLIKYNKNEEYTHLGADPEEINSFRKEFKDIIDEIQQIVEIFGYTMDTQKLQEADREEFVDKPEDMVSTFMSKYALNLSNFNIMTGLTYRDAYLLYNILHKFSIDPKELKNVEWKALQNILTDYLMVVPRYEVTPFVVKGSPPMKPNKKSVEDKVFAMRDLIESKIYQEEIDITKIVRTNPNYFPDENIIFLLDEARVAESVAEETTLLEEATSLIDAKESNGLPIGDELNHKYINVVEYLDGEKDVYIMSDRIRKNGFSDIGDAITNLLDNGGVLNEETAKIFFGTETRDFKDGICNFIQKYNMDVELKNKFFLLSLFVSANKGNVKIDGKSFDIPTLIVEMMMKNGTFFKEFKEFNIKETLIKAKVIMDLEETIREREMIRIRINKERDRLK